MIETTKSIIRDSAALFPLPNAHSPEGKGNRHAAGRPEQNEHHLALLDPVEEEEWDENATYDEADAEQPSQRR